MTVEGRQRIYREDYADLLIKYSGDKNILRKYDESSIRIINNMYATVSVPMDQITQSSILQYGYSVMPSLYGLTRDISLEKSGVTRLRNIPNFDLRGNGVLIGLLDTGIDYTNPIFRYADGTTRIAALWDQTLESGNYPADKFYGTEYSRDQINEALNNSNPYEVIPSKDEIGHGTMIAGIAAGNQVMESQFSGVAPDVELVVVKLKPAKRYLKDYFYVPEQVPSYQENDILSAIEYLNNVSVQLNRPMVVCLALGTSQGAHDGKGSLSSSLSKMSEQIGNAIIIAAGNEGNASRHYYGRINKVPGFDTVELSVAVGEKGFTMEIWGDTPGIFTIDILTPSGEYIPRIVPKLDESREITFIFEQTIIYIDYQIVESQSGDQLILMRFQDPAYGLWRFNIYGRSDMDIGFHIWLPMQGFISEDTFFIRSDPYNTILSLGNAEGPITVTAYNPEDNSLYLNASKGFTRTGIVKPDIAAPGVNIISPNLNHGFDIVTGTSAAAAHTAGIAAMILEWAIVRNNLPSMNTLDLKIFLIRGAQRSTEIPYPNRDWGYGMIDVFSVFDSLRRLG